MVHRMLFDKEYRLKNTVSRVFSGFSFEQFKDMDLGKHHWNHVNGNCRMKIKEPLSLEMIRFIKTRRLKDIFPLSAIIKKEKYEPRIKEDLKAIGAEVVEREPTSESEEDSDDSDDSDETDSDESEE